MYFIANWKMFGDQKSLNSLNKVIKFSKINKNNKFKLIYCPPYTLLDLFCKKLKNTNIEVGAQNCHENESYGAYTGSINSKINKNNKFKLIYCPPYTLLDLFYKKLINTNIDVGAQNCHENENYGAYTGSINSKMIKKVGAKYVIIGHSENRANGESDLLVNKKIKSSIKNGLKIIFCFGETLSQRKKRLTHKILTNQIIRGLSGINKLNNILFAYEPIWSVGTGVIPNKDDLEKDIIFIKNKLRNNFSSKNAKVLYGGSVDPKNITILKKINAIDGFLIGGASKDSKKFIDIVKKTVI